MLMLSIQWADTEEAQNSYAFFRSPASVSCELWFNLNFYHQIAQKLCKILNISIKATFDMQIYLKNSYELIKKIEGSLI